MLLALGQVFGWQSGGEDEQKENKEEQADATSKREEQKKIEKYLKIWAHVGEAVVKCAWLQQGWE